MGRVCAVRVHTLYGTLCTRVYPGSRSPRAHRVNGNEPGICRALGQSKYNKNTTKKKKKLPTITIPTEFDGNFSDRVTYTRDDRSSTGDPPTRGPPAHTAARYITAILLTAIINTVQWVFCRIIPFFFFFYATPPRTTAGIVRAHPRRVPGPSARTPDRNHYNNICEHSDNNDMMATKVIDLGEEIPKCPGHELQSFCAVREK